MPATLLAHRREPMIYSGMVLRFPAILPYEDWVDFMLIVLPNQSNALLVATGYKAGLVAQVLPTEAGPTGAIRCDWLIENWSKWVFPPTSVEQVYVLQAMQSQPVQSPAG